MGRKGELDTERFHRALLEHRNTPDPITGLSPAMVVYGRRLKGFIPDLTQHIVNRDWQIDREARERAFAKRHAVMGDRLDQSARALPPLPRGAEVAIQDPGINGKPGRWSKTGTVVECLPYDAYMVRVHGSRSVSKRNRVHLRRILPLAPEQYIIPVHNEKVPEIPEHTKTEVTERYVAVQPPKKFVRLSPEAHRRTPAAPPGQDSVTTLRRGELSLTNKDGRGISQTGQDCSGVRDIWDEIPTWQGKEARTGSRDSPEVGDNRD